MSIITTYQEKRMDGYRTFELHPDRLIVKGTQYIGGKFETTVMLHTLEPVLSKVCSRNKAFYQGIGMALVSTMLIQSSLLPITSYWGGLALVLGIGGVLMSLTTARPIEWINIASRAGVTVLSIARAGPDKSSFDPFIELLIKQISAVEQSGSEVSTNKSF